MEESTDTSVLGGAPANREGQGRAAIRGRALKPPFPLVLILMSIGAALWLPRLSGPIDLRYDAGVYYILGTSLAQGKGYRLLNEPGEIEAIQYPPLLPLIIAAHQRVLDSSDPWIVGRALRFSFFMMFMGYVVVAYLMARRFVTERYAFLVGLVTTLYLYNWWLSDYCFAELPFALTTILFVLLNNSKRRGPAFLAASLAVAAYLLRTAGIALLVAWVGESLLRREWKKAIVRLSVCFLPVILWQSHIKRVEASDAYQNPAYIYQRADYQFHNVSYATNRSLADGFAPEKGRVSSRDVAVHFLKNIKAIPVSLGESVTTTRGYWVWQVSLLTDRAGLPPVPPRLLQYLLAALGSLVAGGIVVLLRRGEVFIPIYVLASLALLCLTPWPEHFPRYLAPLTPLLLVSLVLMLSAIQTYLRRCVPRGMWKAACPVFVTAIMVMAALVQLGTVYLTFTKRHSEVVYGDRDGRQLSYRLFFYDDTWKAFDAALDWLKDTAAPEDIIAASAPSWVYLRTGHKAVFPPFERDVKTEQLYLDSVPVQYLIVDDFPFLNVMQKYARPTTEEHAGWWKLVYSEPSGRIRIYRRAN